VSRGLNIREVYEKKWPMNRLAYRKMRQTCVTRHGTGD
jgi:hypothetical protein